jgi:pimeloyl-ACP methyl ester carboxylesterase
MFSDGPAQDLVPWVKEMALKNTPHVMVEMWLAIIQKDYRDMLDKITVPCLYTYGARKSLYTKENAEWLQEHIPNCEIAAFDGGHIHFLQDAENFNKVVMEFIDK